MNHDVAKKIFETIQARPYRLASGPGIVAENCYFKGIELLQKLGGLGYAVRGRVGETYWDRKIVPGEIMDLLPPDVLTTHFFVEVMIDGDWRIVDPTFQPGLAEYGFVIGAWEGTPTPCFPITRLYTQEENIVYQAAWADPAYQDRFFRQGAACWQALDRWFAKAAEA